MADHDDRDDTALPPRAAFDALLHEAHGVGGHAIDRLRELSGRFPSALPPPVLRQLEVTHSDPAADRRTAVRLGGDGIVVGVWPRCWPWTPTDGVVVDYSRSGLRVQLGFPPPDGAILLVRLCEASVNAGRWVPARVRHLRRHGERWEAGCEFVGGPAV